MPERLHCEKQIASYVGSFRRRSRAAIVAAGTHQQARQRAAAFLLVEAAQVTVRSQPEWRSTFLPRYATGKKDCESGDGAEAGGASLLDVGRQGYDYGEL